MKHKNFGARIIKTDVYGPSSGFLVRFERNCDSYITYIAFSLSVMVASLPCEQSLLRSS